MKLIFLIFAACFAAQINDAAFAQANNPLFGKYIDVLPGGTLIFSSALKDYSYPPDTLALWNYKYKAYVGAKTDSVEPLGVLILWRNKPVIDKDYLNVHKVLPVPVFVFSVYNLSDSAHCEKEALRGMMISNCLPPEVGGDHFVIGKYFFVNYGLCVPCVFLGTDYCRPMLGEILHHVDAHSVNSLADIFKQFDIKAGQASPKSSFYDGKDWRDE